MITNKKIPVYIDWTFCLILLPLMIFLLPVERWAVANPLFVCLFIGWLYMVYVINRRYTIPLLFKERKRIAWAITILVVTVLVTYLLTRFQVEFPRYIRPIRHIHRMNDDLFTKPLKIRQYQQAVWFLYMVVSVFSMAVSLLTELYRQLMMRQTVEFEKKKAELALYKAQINPHFLFNSLNTLYAMVITQSEKTEDAFMKFINLMKYMYINNIKDKISIHTEVEYIRQYIELQKYRMPECVHIHFSYEYDETEQKEIAPMILITFVENVFKHGISSCNPSDAFVTIRAKNGELCFSTCNPQLNQVHKKESKGIGIENCRKRLELLYPGKYTLSAEEKEGYYVLTLTINLDNEHKMYSY